MEIAKKEFEILEQLHIVRPSSSPWASPLHMVKKNDGSWRPCGDYRQVNSITTPDRYPIPNLQHIHHEMAGCTIFTKLDLVKAYHFIPVRAKDIQKTAIITPFGSFEYLRMPFGLRNAAGTFQRFIDSLLRKFSFALAYVDDIIIFSRSPVEHEQHLNTILSKLESVGLRVNANKCSIGTTEIEFLGYTINGNGIKPPESRVKALRDLPNPKDSKELVRYLGMFGFYQRCIRNYAKIVSPLRDLVSSPFNWTTEHNTCFEGLKESLAHATQLGFPKKDYHFTITADASLDAIGACLNKARAMNPNHCRLSRGDYHRQNGNIVHLTGNS